MQQSNAYEIFCLGLSHHNTPLALREKLTWDNPRLESFLVAQISKPYIDELIVLSTCNRVEVYFVSAEKRFDEITQELAKESGEKIEEINAHSYRLENRKAVDHLFTVAAGLDSLLLGEDQILGQVSNAFQFSQNFSAVGPRLSKLFQAAIHSGKRVRTDTTFAQSGTSIPSLAVKLAFQKLKKNQDAKVIMLGAGEMSELALAAFHKRGLREFTIISRTAKSAELLVWRWGGRVGNFENLGRYLKQADVVLSSSSAQGYLLDKSFLQDTLGLNSPQKLLILDIAVPRDVDPEVRHLPNVHLYDMDDLQQMVEKSKISRIKQTVNAKRIVQQEVENFWVYWSSLNVVPLIKDLRQQAEGIRLNELHRTFRRMPELSESDKEVINALTRSIVQKILHHPTMQLRQQAADQMGDSYSEMARELFGLKSQQKK